MATESARPATVLPLCAAGLIGLVCFGLPSWIGISDTLWTLGVSSIVLGAWAFLDHGRHVITAAGIYMLSAGLFIGAGCIYYTAASSSPITENDTLHVAIWSYLATVATYAWWVGSRREPIDRIERFSPRLTTFARRWGFASLLVGLAMHFGHFTIGTLDQGFTFDGAILLAGGVVLGQSAGRRLPLWRLTPALLPLGIYVATQFSGSGRLVLVALGFATLFLVQGRLRVRHLKLLVVLLLVPSLGVGAFIGRHRNASDPSELQAGGLVSLVSPLNEFGQEVQVGLHTGGVSPLVGDITFSIPRSVWVGKPLSFGQHLAEDLNPAVFALDNNDSAAALNEGEWYYIAGWPGVVLMVLVTGFGVRWIDKRFRRRRSEDSSSPSALLGLIALIILAAGMADLAWAGSSTFTGRTVPRLLVLIPIALVLWLRPERVDKRPGVVVQAHRRQLVSIGASADFLGDLENLWEAPTRPGRRLPAIPEVLPAERSGSARRAGSALLDQALSSLQNYVVLFAALRTLSLVQFGEFSVAYIAMPMLLGTVRSLVMEPFMIRFTAATARDRNENARDAFGAALLVAGLVSILSAAGALSVGNSEVRGLLLAFAVATPIMILQDAWRMYFFASRNPLRAAVNDAICLAMTAPLVVLLVATHHASGPLLVLIWAIGTAAGVLAGIAQLQIVPRPSGATKWLSSTRTLGPDLAGGRLADSTLALATYTLVGVVVSTGAIGILGASIAVLAPVTTAVTAIAIFILPESALWLTAGRRRLLKQTARTSLLLSASVLMIAGFIAVLPPPLTRLLAGSHWHEAKELLLPVALWVAASSARQAPATALRVLHKSRQILFLSIGTDVATLIGALGGGYLYGIHGVAWGYCVIQTAALVPWWSVVLRAKLPTQGFIDLPSG